jgi:hypothetical protein
MAQSEAPLYSLPSINGKFKLKYDVPKQVAGLPTEEGERKASGSKHFGSLIRQSLVN